MKKMIVASAGAILLAASSLSFAVTPKSEGFYVGGNVGCSSVNLEVNGVHDSVGFGWNVDAGYMFNKAFAVEADFLGYPDHEYKVGHFRSKISSNYAGVLALVGMIPFDSGFSVFGKLGAAAVHHKHEAVVGALLGGNVHKTVTTAFFGAGVSYAISENLNVNLGANTTGKVSGVPAMWQTTIGLSYMF